MSVRGSALGWLVGLTVAVSVCACARDEDEDNAAATATSALRAQNEAGLTDALLDTDGTLAPEPEDAARMVAERPARGLFPEGCATKTQAGNAVSVVMRGCTGPFGKVAIDGTLVATFSKMADDVVHVEIVASPGATANGRDFSYASQSDVRYEGPRRTITYRGSSSGTTARGRSYSRATNVTVATDMGTHCVAIDGTSTGKVGPYDIDLTIDGFRACRDTCPTAGTARANVNGPLVRGASITVTFDGSDQIAAKVDARRDRELSITLDCQAGEAE